jgi:hypothetical protein
MPMGILVVKPGSWSRTSSDVPIRHLCRIACCTSRCASRRVARARAAAHVGVREAAEAQVELVRHRPTSPFPILHYFYALLPELTRSCRRSLRSALLRVAVVADAATAGLAGAQSASAMTAAVLPPESPSLNAVTLHPELFCNGDEATRGPALVTPPPLITRIPPGQLTSALWTPLLNGTDWLSTN